MIRSRTVRLAAIAVLGSAVLAGTTGCGGPKEAGVAVTVDGTSTTDRQIQDRVAAMQKVDDQYGAEIAKIQQAAAGSGGGQAKTDPGRDQVAQLIDVAVWNRVAAMVGVSATAKQDHAEFENLAGSAAGAFTAIGATVQDTNEVKASILLQGYAHNIAPAGVADFAHMSLLQNAVIMAVAQKMNVDPSTINQPGPLYSAVEQLVAKALSETSVKVSPRYTTAGVLVNPQTLTSELDTAPPAWVRVAPTAAAPAADQQQPQDQSQGQQPVS